MQKGIMCSAVCGQCRGIGCGKMMHSQMSLMMNVTLTKMKIALIPRELRRKETSDAILLVVRR